MVNAKLTIDQKREIARKYEAKEAKEANIPQLAREYGVTNALVSKTIGKPTPSQGKQVLHV